MEKRKKRFAYIKLAILIFIIVGLPVILFFTCRDTLFNKEWLANLPEFIMQGVVDLIENHGEYLEIIDYKTGPKPDIITNPEKIAHYKRQLEVYAYLVGKRFGKRVNRMSLYYTNCKDGDPLITFEWSRESIEKAVSEITEIIRKIETKNFDGGVKNGYACAYCEMRHLCGKG